MKCKHCGAVTPDDSKFCGVCGKPPQAVAGLVCPACATEIEVGQRFCVKCGAAADAGKDGILAAITEALAQHSQLNLVCGQKTDIEISSTLADVHWTVGKKKVSYSACVLADEASRTIIFWEMIKETSAGLGAIFTFVAETFRSDGRTISGKIKECGYGLNGKAVDYQWDYSQVRHLVERAVKEKGWKFKTVLLKGKAMY